MIEFINVSKHFKTEGQKKVILDHASVRFEKGTSYGLLGVNGAGKSTTLRMISGSSIPTSGTIRRKRRVSWPLGFSGGFHPRMTGRDNVNFVARAYGADVRKVADFVDDFAELGDYIRAPVSTYSSGMLARLAFGLSMAIDFDCYLIDEVTAVGDARFAARCREVFAQRRQNSDLIVVSHGMDTIKQYCDQAFVLVDGHLLHFDRVEQAIEMYFRLNR